jgi:hypothetical protein
MERIDPSSTQAAPAKRPYRSPRLKEYGDIRAVTKAGSPVGMGDGAMAGATKSVTL